MGQAVTRPSASISARPVGDGTTTLDRETGRSRHSEYDNVTEPTVDSLSRALAMSKRFASLDGRRRAGLEDLFPTSASSYSYPRRRPVRLSDYDNADGTVPHDPTAVEQIAFIDESSSATNKSEAASVNDEPQRQPRVTQSSDTSSVVRLRREKPGVFFIIRTFFAIATYILDVVVDIHIGVLYFKLSRQCKSGPYEAWFALTVAFLVLPSIVMSGLNLAWYHDDYASHRKHERLERRKAARVALDKHNRAGRAKLLAQRRAVAENGTGTDELLRPSAEVVEPYDPDTLSDSDMSSYSPFSSTSTVLCPLDKRREGGNPACSSPTAPRVRHIHASKCAWALRFLVSALQLNPVVRYIELLAIAFHASRYSDTWSDGYAQFVYVLASFEDVDAAMLRLIEAFLEAAPQTILHIYVMQKLPLLQCGHAAAMDSFVCKVGIPHGAELECYKAIQIFSTVTAIISIAVAIVNYHNALRNSNFAKKRLTPSGFVFMFLWKIGMISSRLVSIAFFASAFPFYMMLMGVIHFVIMLMFVFYIGTAFCATKVQEIFFRVVCALIFCFDFLNVKEGRTRFYYTFYYAIIFVENCIMIGCWYFFGLKQEIPSAHFAPEKSTLLNSTLSVGSNANSSFQNEPFQERTTKKASHLGLPTADHSLKNLLVLVAVPSLFFFGLAAMLLYYRFFHPERRSLVTSVERDDTTSKDADKEDVVDAAKRSIEQPVMFLPWLN